MYTDAPADDAFGRLLLDRRVTAGLSREDLAHASGVSVRALADMERGRTRWPQHRTVQALARALGLGETEARAMERAAGLDRPRPRPAVRQAPMGTPAVCESSALPRDVADYTGRANAFAELSSLAADIDPSHPPVVVISGQPGLGKTTFAVHAARALAGGFPDGCLYVDLRGSNRGSVDARTALSRLIRTLGDTDPAIPPETEDRSTAYRSAAAGRKLLVLLDDAVDEDQIRPLLPGQGHVLTLVTSRNHLAGLESVHRIALPLFTREEAVLLLTRIIGPERLRAEEQAARDLADLAGHLPLAVRITGQRLAAHPTERLDKLAGQLTSEDARLDTLRAGDLGVREAFAASYERLTPDARLLLRRAALTHGADFGVEFAAVLSGLSPGTARRCVEELRGRSLLEPHPALDRYHFPALLRAFARERLAEEDQSVLEETEERGAWWLLDRSRAAGLRLGVPGPAPVRDGPAEPAGIPGAGTGDSSPAAPAGSRDPAQARTWLQAERTEWAAALRWALRTGRYRQVVDTATALRWYAQASPEWVTWVDVFRDAVAAARVLGEPRAEAAHLNHLAWAHHTCARDFPAALETAERALIAARRTGDRLQTGWALSHGARALRRLGRTGESIAWLRDAAACHGGGRSPEERLAELVTLNTLGIHLREAGHAAEALEIHRRAEALCGDAPEASALPEPLAFVTALTLRDLGEDLAALRRWEESSVRLQRAAEAFDHLQAPMYNVRVFRRLGTVLSHLLRHDEARQARAAARTASLPFDASA